MMFLIMFCILKLIERRITKHKCITFPLTKLIASSICLSVTSSSKDSIPELPLDPENGRNSINWFGTFIENFCSD